MTSERIKTSMKESFVQETFPYQFIFLFTILATIMCGQYRSVLPAMTSSFKVLSQSDHRISLISRLAHSPGQ